MEEGTWVERFLPRKEYDTIDVITYVLLILFIVTVFQNITYLNSPDIGTAQLALTSLAVALICIAGISVKIFFDNAGLTKTETAGIGGDDLFSIGIYVAITFGSQFLIFFMILQIPIQSVIATDAQFFAIAVIASVSEEFFFTYALQSLITKYAGFWGVFAVAGIFMYYHWVVYSSTIILLIMMFVLRMIYGSVYFWSKRLTPLIIAHLLTNLFGAASIA